VKKLRLDSQARAEFFHEITYYEATRPGRGRKFRIAVDEVFVRIKKNPAAGKPEEAGCRRVRVKGFPFAIVFREEASEVVVYAVRPDAREPSYWLARAGDA
jgi:toxin ParE1/3/4